MSGQADTVHDDVQLRRIGFGSCSSPRRGDVGPIFDTLGRQNLDVWIWSGDAVYAKGPEVKDVREAFQSFIAEGSYAKFLSSKVKYVVGTWDDHDLGEFKYVHVKYENEFKLTVFYI